MSQEKQINTSNFKIENNIVSFNNYVLQISNISHISVEPVPKKKFKTWTLILVVIGILMIGWDLVGFGVLLFVIEILYAGVLFMMNTGNEAKYLYIYLNSGAAFYFYCESESFLERVIDVLKYCFNNHSAQVRIDFKKCKLYNSPVITGDGNEVY